jgi:HK97 family phage portal protein
VSVLGRVLAQTTVVPFTPASYDEIIARRSGTGALTVTADTAMAIPAVYACVRAISEDIASVPLQVFRRVGEGKQLATNHPLYDVLHDRPNRYQTALEFREMMTAFAILRGRGIAEIMPGPRGPVDQLKPLHPDLVRSEITDQGALRYVYRDPIAKDERILLPEEVFVVRGPFGRSVLDYARETFAMTASLAGHAAKVYQRAARPSGALTHPKTLTDKARGNLRKALNDLSSGGDAEGRALLLEEGMTWTQIGLSMEDAQFIETLQFSVPQIVRFFRVPLHKIQDLTHATFSNIEQQSIEYVTDAVRPWANRWEGSIARDLMLAPQVFFAEHNLEGLLRGDQASRYSAYAIARQWGWMSVNDIRRRENLDPIAGGDDYLVPLNMTSANGGLLAFAQPPSTEVVGLLRTMVRDAAGRVVRKETAGIAKIEKQTGGTGAEWRESVAAFYQEHARFVASVLRVSDEWAERYCARRCRDVLEMAGSLDEIEATNALTELALNRAEQLRLPAEAAA